MYARLLAPYLSIYCLVSYNRLLFNIGWRAFGSAGVFAVKAPLGLNRLVGNCRDGKVENCWSACNNYRQLFGRAGFSWWEAWGPASLGVTAGQGLRL